MLNIIVCEDNNNQRNHIENIIRWELADLNINSSIELSTGSPKEVIDFLENTTNTYIYFLDVELSSDKNGIELAKEIRKYDPKGYIVFITSHSEMSLLTFQYKVQALDYIIKSDSETLRKRISECLLEVNTNFQKINLKENDEITINFGNKITKFPLNDILFFETTEIDHKLRIHTTEGHFEFYGKIKDIESRTSSDFYKTHRSYLVNTNKIKSIDKENHTILMINNETCYVSARYLKGLIKKCLM